MKAFLVGLSLAIVGILLVVASPFVTYYLLNRFFALGWLRVWIYLGFLPFAVTIMGIGFLIMFVTERKSSARST